METRDLGEIEADLTVFGGAYSNFQAVEALLSVRTGPMLNTGDLVAYCADGEAVVRALAEIPCVAGNMERQLAADADACGCGFEDGSTCAVLSGDWYGYARQRMSEPSRAVMAACPDVVTFRQGGRRFAAIHGGVSDVARFLWPVSADAAFAEEITLVEAAVGPVDGVIAGHSGIAFERQIGRHVWINAGVIGMPENDGRAETRFVVMSGGEARAERLAYDHRAAAARMRLVGLPEGYALALETGWWPSEDVLPLEMRRGGGEGG